MVTIELTDEEFFVLKSIMQRIVPKSERNPRVRKWIKYDGCMINLQSGFMLDISSNKFVIGQEPDLRAIADQMSIPHFSAFPEPTRALLERPQ